MTSAYIEERIRRASPPSANVIDGSTPVIAFGNAQLARVATLGLNPSGVEFVGADGVLLTGTDRRLATHPSLGTAALSSAPYKIIEQVAQECNEYFERNPYRRWFNQLLPIVQMCGACYYDGSACHLDLVQWATSPVWGRLRRDVREQLVAEDVDFLGKQLQNENIDILLINGRGALTHFSQQFINKITIDEVHIINSRQPVKIYAGSGFGKITIVGWSTNIQSSFGVTTELRIELAEQIGRLASSRTPI